MSTMMSTDSATRSTRSIPTPAMVETSDSTLLEVVAEMNNEGAFQLEHMFYPEAIATFTSALTMTIREEARSLTEGQLGELGTVLTGLLGTLLVVTEREPSRSSSSWAAAKPKKTKRRKTRRCNSMSSVGNKDAPSTSSTAATTTTRNSSSSNRRRRTPSRRERRRELVQRVRSAFRNDDPPAATEDILLPPLKHVYAKPLRVLDRYNLPGRNELAIYLVRNLALAYQLWKVDNNSTAASSTSTLGGGNSGEESQAEWETIIQLYKLAADMITREQQHQEESEDAVTDPNSPLWSPTAMVALPNNLACAYHSSGDVANANETWQQTLVHMWCILDIGCVAEVECFDDILENASHLLELGVQVRPAAAA
jgi:hypothetical protein